MRRCHSNNECKWSLEEFISGIRENFPQYSGVSDEVIAEKIKPFGELCCVECHSAQGRSHNQNDYCKHFIRGRSDYEGGEWVMFYPDPCSMWAHYNLAEKAICTVCGDEAETEQNGNYLCLRHARKLKDRLRKYRKLLNQAFEEKEMVELEFYNHSIKEISREIEASN